MGMNADGRIQPRDPLDQVEGPLRGRPVPARHQQPLDACGSGPSGHVVDIAVEAIGLEMAVAVDEAHAPRQAGRLLWKSPTSLPSGSMTTANHPMPGISCFGSFVVPPLASDAAIASSIEATSI